jgi:hypothetical protein
MATNKKALLKLPAAPNPEKKKGPSAAEKLQLVGTDNVLKALSSEHLTSLLGKKPSFPVSLDLTGNHFQLENDEWLKGVPNVLKELDLTGNCLSQFMNGRHLTKLKRLILEKNTIARLSLQGLQNLEYLSLSNNHIEHLPDMSDLKKLVYLDLSQNRILTGWNELEKLQSLRVLDLGDCRIDLSINEFHNFILQPLRKLPKLEYLNFAGNSICRNIPHFKFFVIVELPKLKYLDWDEISKEDRSVAEKLNAEGKWKDKSNPVVQIEKKRSSVAEVTTDAKRRSSSSDTSSTAKAAPDLQKMAKITENDENARNTVATTTLDKLDEIVTTPLHQVQKMGDTPRDGDTQAVDYMNLLDEMLQTGVHTLPIQQKEDPKGRSLEFAQRVTSTS